MRDANGASLDRRTPVLLELGVQPEAVSILKNYLGWLWAANEELNLISRKMTYEELIDNHLIDCLLPLERFPTRAEAVADFGSGGGLPGVVYAILFPRIRFHLFEKSPRKREFLHRCREWAPNLEIHGEIPGSLKAVDSGIEVVMARAFKPIDVILDMSRDHFSKGGRYFLFKGRREKIEEELLLARRKFRNLQLQFQVEVIPLTSPVLEVERHLVRLALSIA